MLEKDQESRFVAWLDAHGASVMKVARAYTVTADETQDLAQEILLQAWRSATRFRRKSVRFDVVLSSRVEYGDELASERAASAG